MPTSILFQLEHGAVELNCVSNYVVLNCLQWKSPHLNALASAAKQSFAVIYENELDQELIDYLERVHLHRPWPTDEPTGRRWQREELAR